MSTQPMNRREAAWRARNAARVDQGPEAGAGHAALVRGDDGNLHIRHFATAQDAAVASAGRELEPPSAVLPPTEQVQAVIGRRSGEMRHTEFARTLGLTPRQVRDCWKRGGLPGAKEHSAYILVVPRYLLRLAQTYGLRQVERMAKAGLLSSPAS
jgi:hypothetical protein